MAGPSFDFAGFRRAFVDQDVTAWAAYFAADGQWIEYKHTHPPRAPRVMNGRGEIEEFLGRVKSSGASLEIGDEVIGPDRAAFRVWCTLAELGVTDAFSGELVAENAFRA